MPLSTREASRPSPQSLVPAFRSDSLDLAHHPKQVAAPHLRDLLLGIAATHELHRDVERLAGLIPSVHAATAVEVRADPDVVDADQLHGVVDVVDEVLDGSARRWRKLAVDLRHATLVGFAFLWR